MHAKTETSDFPTIRAASRRAGVDLRLAIRAGEIATYRPGPQSRWRRVHWPEVVAWIKAQRCAAPSEAARARAAELIARRTAADAG